MSEWQSRSAALLLLGLSLAFACPCVVRAQTQAAATTTAPAPEPTPDPAEARIAHARALAAAHRLASAAAELDSIRTSTTDDSLRDVACIMLMNIYLEEGDYTRADALLREVFKARTPAQQSSVQAYFALAGQTINGARHHIERYREFGINISDRSLPPEAQYDLERLRALLELIATQATEISGEAAKSTDAIALLEDVAGVRASVAKDDDDRRHWQQEFASARQRLAASETRIASISPGIPGRQISNNAPTASAAARTNAPAQASNNSGPVSPSSSSNAKRSNSSNRPSAPASDAANSSSALSSPTPSNTAQPHAAAEKRTGGDAGSAGPAASGQLMDVGSLLEKAKQKVNPLYPATARNVRVTGVVTVYLVVDENGAVEAVQRTSGPQMLRQAAVDAAKRWKFNPTLVDGQPVRVAGYISFNFTL